MIKLLVQRETLLRPLQAVTSVIERRHTIPILSHVVMAAKDNNITFTGTDLEVELTATIKINTGVTFPTEITFPGKKFFDICRELPENSIIEIAGEGDNLIVSSGRSRFVLQTLPVKNFPRSPKRSPLISFAITKRSLRDLLGKTTFAIPQQDVRQYLNGLFFKMSDGIINALATDGHRVALCNTASTVTDKSFAQVIIPRKCALELLHLVDDSDDEVVIDFCNNFVCITGQDFVLTSKLINCKFPNYHRAIPKRGELSIEINREVVRQALVRVGILSNELFRSVRFQLRHNILVLTTDNPGQEDGVEELPIDYQKEFMDSIFNVGYFIDILNNIETENVRISFSGNDSPAIVEGIGSNIDYMYVLMPIK